MLFLVDMPFSIFFLYVKWFYILICPGCADSHFIFCAFQASENLGMAMIYTLVTSAKEWLSERYGQDADAEEEEAVKDEV